MKKTIISILCLILFHGFIPAHGAESVLPEEGELLGYYTSNMSFLLGIRMVASIKGKKEINGKTYKILGYFTNTLWASQDYEVTYIREENGKVYAIPNDNPKSDPAHEYQEEKLIYDFSCQPGESFVYYVGYNNQEPLNILIEKREIANLYGKDRVVLTTNKGRIAEGLGCLENGTFDRPFQIDYAPSGIIKRSEGLYGLPNLEEVFDFQGIPIGRDPEWVLNENPEREYLPMLKENRVWEYCTNKTSDANPVFYKAKEQTDLFGEMYYPIARSNTADFVDEVDVGYMKEANGQVFFRPIFNRAIPGYDPCYEESQEINYYNYGNVMMLYDMNLQPGDIMHIDAQTLFHGNYLEAKESRDIEYYLDGSTRKYVITTSCRFLEGIGVVSGGTLPYPGLPVEIDWMAKPSPYILTRVTDNGKIIFDRKAAKISASTADSDFRVWSEEGTIRAEGAMGEVAVYDMSGRCIYQGNGETVSGLQKGVYIVRCGADAVKIIL